MSQSSRNKLYNYLVNTFGLSKDVVMTQAEKRIEDILEKHIHSKLSANGVEKLILGQVASIVKHGLEKGAGYWKTTITFEDYVKSVIKDVVQQKLNDEYSVEVKIVKKEVRAMGTIPNAEGIK
jgi:hypothetical protein